MKSSSRTRRLSEAIAVNAPNLAVISDASVDDDPGSTAVALEVQAGGTSLTN